jgi:hypothetical protein
MHTQKKPKMEKKMKRVICCLIGGLLQTSCISLRKGELETTEGVTLTLSAAKKPSIAVFVDVDWRLNGLKTHLVDQQLTAIRGKVIDHYRASGLFSEVQEIRYILDIPSAKTDYVARVTVVGNEDSMILMGVLTGLTLYIIPSWSTIEYNMETKFFKGATSERGVVKSKETVTFVQQLLMLFGMPFAFPTSVINETIKDLTYSGLKEGIQKKYIE